MCLPPASVIRTWAFRLNKSLSSPKPLSFVVALTLGASVVALRFFGSPAAPGAGASAFAPVAPARPVSEPTSPTDPDAASALIAGSGGFHLELDGRLFSDPEEALRFADAGPADLRLAAYLRIAEVWGPEDLVAAARWAQSLPDAMTRSDVLTRLGEVMLPVSPDAAFALADRLPTGTPRTSFCQALVHRWSEEAPAAAAAWLPRIADPGLRAELQSAVAVEWAQGDPRSAAAFVATQMSAGEVQLAAARTVAPFPDPAARTELTALAVQEACPAAPPR